MKHLTPKPILDQQNHISLWKGRKKKETKFTDWNGNAEELIHHLFSGKQICNPVEWKWKLCFHVVFAPSQIKFFSVLKCLHHQHALFLYFSGLFTPSYMCQENKLFWYLTKGIPSCHLKDLHLNIPLHYFCFICALMLFPSKHVPLIGCSQYYS